MSWDPIARKLHEAVPVMDSRLAEAFERYENLTIAELEEAWERIQAEFRAWVETPGNETRPIQEAPVYIDRIAVDSLRERRTWWE